MNNEVWLQGLSVLSFLTNKKQDETDLTTSETISELLKKLLETGVRMVDVLRVVSDWNNDFFRESPSLVLSEVFGDELILAAVDIDNAISSLSKNYQEDYNDIQSMRNECSLLNSTPRIFSSPHACSGCSLKITELPAIHFSCMHSFHLGCLEYGPQEKTFKCLLCSSEVDHRTAMQNQRLLEQGLLKYD